MCSRFDWLNLCGLMNLYLVLGYASQPIPEFLRDDAFYKFDWDLQQQVLQQNEPVVSFDPNEEW